MLLKDVRDKMDIVPGLSREEFITRCYATEILEEVMSMKHLIIFDDVESWAI